MESDLARRARHTGDVQIHISPDDFASEHADGKIKQMLQAFSSPDIDRVGHTTIHITRNPQEHKESDSTGRDADLDQLRRNLQKWGFKAQAGTNPFTRQIHILQAGLQKGYLPFIAKIDTASSKNWIRPQVVEKLALEPQVQQLELSTSDWFKGAGGELFQASGSVSLTWYDSVVTRTRETEFLISCEDAPFDLIFGWEWLTADGESAFAEPFLAIMKEIKLTEGWSTPVTPNASRQANLRSRKPRNASELVQPERRERKACSTETRRGI